MTSPQVDAGRELDAKVAEEVFGITLEVVRPAFPDAGWGWKDPVVGSKSPISGWEEYSCSEQPTKGVGTITFWEPPRYSAEIESAWKVVEKMTQPEKTRFVVYYGDGWATAMFIPLTSAPTEAELRFGPQPIEAEAGTVPLAICRCTLKAVRADTEGPDG